MLEARRRCFLALAGPDGPVLRPLRYWYDGQHAWTTTAEAALPGVGEEAACALWLPADDGPGLLAQGRVRVFGAGEPLRLLLHAPAITGALAALAADNAGAVADYVQEAARNPGRLDARGRIVLRIRVDSGWPVTPEKPGFGVAPAIPTAVPAEVRRVVGGCRDVVVAAAEPRLAVLPAVLGPGFRLTAAAGALPTGSKVEVVIDPGEGSPAGGSIGLALGGRISEEVSLELERATWWNGARVGSAPVNQASAGSGIVLPD